MMVQVFSEADRDILIKNGYKLMYEFKESNRIVYIFENTNKLKFDELGVKAMVTNKLYF